MVFTGLGGRGGGHSASTLEQPLCFQTQERSLTGLGGGVTFSSHSGAALVLTDTGEEPHVPLVFYYTDYENQE